MAGNPRIACHFVLYCTVEYELQLQVYNSEPGNKHIQENRGGKNDRTRKNASWILNL